MQPESPFKAFGGVFVWSALQCNIARMTFADKMEQSAYL